MFKENTHNQIGNYTGLDDYQDIVNSQSRYLLGFRSSGFFGAD